MKRPSSIGWFVVVVVIASLLVGCRTPAGRTPGEVVDDATITTAVKAKLFRDPYLSGFAISVTTFKGEVTLTGAVDNQYQKDRATAVARSVPGVVRVHNLLKIK
ncbi:BON domain-containing protein [Thermodesulforhabdus norvegica]|uniref:Osmotically-inducible protein Y n=1 Tax=Thermodesulforhabdus norvegica TaxID=39841 RepID=A0A1I4QFP2_9BACT|nr:BON domain-containing protein [Thermodesulforhabdus norvegica]SFM38942.1 BON domain-containing protein [Thermodesulforhabdus norvegica]